MLQTISAAIVLASVPVPIVIARPEQAEMRPGDDHVPDLILPPPPQFKVFDITTTGNALTNSCFLRDERRPAPKSTFWRDLPRYRKSRR